ncbi:MAG: ATP phosphoribosyltransferase regulatory subunit [Geobacteraceae bacterium]|nr:ATP phosphoribosyltransferase regulatory subunit [Geobacteraceae bacterium]
MFNAAQNLLDNSLPKGVTDFLPEQAEKIGFIENIISKTFELWGFRKIIPPMIEFEELLAVGMDDSLREKSFRFEDRQSHKLLAIPPDITPQVARIESMRMAGYPLPHRLYYNSRVLRHVESQSGRSRELYQSGVELIGLDSPEADAETIAMSVEALKKIGFPGFKIDLGQVEFFKGIIAAAGLDNVTTALIQSAVARKDTSAVKEAVESLSITDFSKREILALPRLFGGKEVLDKAASIVGNDQSKRALDNLFQIIDILEIHGIKDDLTIDLGEIRGLAYHTGVTFEGFVPGLGEPVCGGGRYDSLMARYGRSCPATGFAFNVLNLLHAYEKMGGCEIVKPPVILIFNMNSNRADALSLASGLRLQGFPVARDIIRRDIDQSLAYSRQMGIGFIVVIPENDLRDNNLEVIRVENSVKNYVKMSDLMADATSIFKTRNN